MNVYLVQGLKSNLISVSQLCDKGLNKLECKAIDADGKAVLRGVRSGNNCYMWDQSAKCLSVRDDVELWHKRLGHMNIRHLTTLVNKEIVRGVPKLKGCEKIVCGPCNQGKQVKVQHKKVPDVQSKSALDLVDILRLKTFQGELWSHGPTTGESRQNGEKRSSIDLLHSSIDPMLYNQLDRPRARRAESIDPHHAVPARSICLLVHPLDRTHVRHASFDLSRPICVASIDLTGSIDPGFVILNRIEPNSTLELFRPIFSHCLGYAVFQSVSLFLGRRIEPIVFTVWRRFLNPLFCYFLI
ncbi:unnamed protein product [Microthlaspi erraticum]|uniref:GAG-pre-integrase domain-containing protein n=1 Tax=Microthlaspi erraticum TaxID=1685480 RepID=A0A6D2HYF9_9BRAS|nr:unnamed protein product [Microthlaspi erraticum]